MECVPFWTSAHNAWFGTKCRNMEKMWGHVYYLTTVNREKKCSIQSLNREKGERVVFSFLKNVSEHIMPALAQASKHTGESREAELLSFPDKQSVAFIGQK